MALTKAALLLSLAAVTALGGVTLAAAGPHARQSKRTERDEVDEDYLENNMIDVTIEENEDILLISIEAIVLVIVLFAVIAFMVCFCLKKKESEESSRSKIDALKSVLIGGDNRGKGGVYPEKDLPHTTNMTSKHIQPKNKDQRYYDELKRDKVFPYPFDPPPSTKKQRTWKRGPFGTVEPEDDFGNLDFDLIDSIVGTMTERSETDIRHAIRNSLHLGDDLPKPLPGDSDHYRERHSSFSGPAPSRPKENSWRGKRQRWQSADRKKTWVKERAYTDPRT